MCADHVRSGLRFALQQIAKVGQLTQNLDSGVGMKNFIGQLARRLVLGCVLLMGLGMTQARACQQTISGVNGQWQQYEKDEFVLQYSLTGDHALQFPADTRKQGVPDVVADVALQLVAMRDVLAHLKFQLPLESTRYQLQGARRILVRFRSLDGGTGRAYDEVHQSLPGECVLLMDISNRYRSGNLTPAHELFHLVQYGYTMFKRAWFLEGMARWSETLLGKRTAVVREVPEDEASLEAIWNDGYGAVSAWYGLIGQCGREPHRVVLPESVLALQYSTGKPVVEDEMAPGYGYIRKVLEELSALDKTVGARDGHPAYRWKERDQKARRYDAEIWKAAVKACI